MDIATTPAVERIARVLAGRHASANADGDETSAARLVDNSWPEYREDALAILKTLREPSEAMTAAGDAAVWERMILAAIDEARPAIVM